MLKYIVSSNSPDRESKSLTIEELLADLSSTQLEIIRREQNDETTLPYNLFKTVHTLTECQVIRRQVGYITNGWVFPDYDGGYADTSTVCVLRCLRHGTKSKPYVHDGARGDMDLRKFLESVPNARFVSNSSDQ